jgi:hypothetical protein
MLVALAVLACALAAALPAPAAAGEAEHARPAARASATIYLLSGEQFAPVRRTIDVEPGADPLGATLRALLRGPTPTELARKQDTAIPPAASLVRSSRDGRTAVLSFNRAFAAPKANVKTKLQAEQDYQGRLGQVTYTATGVRGIDAVRISVPGKRTVTLTRADFKQSGEPPAATNQPVGGVTPADPRSVQQALVRLKYLLPGAVTGTYDYRTQQAVLAFQAWEGLQRDGIVGPQTAARLQTASPPTPRGSGPGNRAEVFEQTGVLLLVRDNTLVRAIHASTGKGGTGGELGTPLGTYKVTRKEVRSWSVPFQVWLPWAVYFNGGIAIHGYPDVPAYPASHGCVRVPLVEAPVVYSFLAVGDQVTVYRD